MDLSPCRRVALAVLMGVVAVVSSPGLPAAATPSPAGLDTPATRDVTVGVNTTLRVRRGDGTTPWLRIPLHAGDQPFLVVRNAAIPGHAEVGLHDAEGERVGLAVWDGELGVLRFGHDPRVPADGVYTLRFSGVGKLTFQIRLATTTPAGTATPGNPVTVSTGEPLQGAEITIPVPSGRVPYLTLTGLPSDRTRLAVRLVDAAGADVALRTVRTTARGYIALPGPGWHDGPLRLVLTPEAPTTPRSR